MKIPQRRVPKGPKARRLRRSAPFTNSRRTRNRHRPKPTDERLTAFDLVFLVFGLWLLMLCIYVIAGGQ